MLLSCIFVAEIYFLIRVSSVNCLYFSRNKKLLRNTDITFIIISYVKSNMESILTFTLYKSIYLLDIMWKNICVSIRLPSDPHLKPACKQTPFSNPVYLAF